MNEPRALLPLSAVLATAMLTVGCNKPPEPVATVPAVTVPVGNVSDIDVTEHVKTALHQSAALQGFDIAVLTTNGDVRLIGVLRTQAQVDEAIKIARAADGTHSVHDELTVKK